MKKVVIFGAGDLGRCFYTKYKNIFNILFFVDNNIHQDNEPAIFPPSILKETDFDTIYICSAHGLEQIYAQLVEEFNIPAKKINKVWAESHIEEHFIANRIKFLEDYAEYCYLHDIDGALAEVGVCRGDFACEINRVFPDKKLYLYDTFEGFDSRDLLIERQQNHNYNAIEAWVSGGRMDFTNTSVDIVRSRLPYPEQVSIKKGFFPETFDVDSKDKYIFVNLDTDLYQPIKDGLEIFYPRMVRGGLILIHDYYSMLFGVTKAVDEFITQYQASAFPVGDRKSLAIIKG